MTVYVIKMTAMIGRQRENVTIGRGGSWGGGGECDPLASESHEGGGGGDTEVLS